MSKGQDAQMDSDSESSPSLLGLTPQPCSGTQSWLFSLCDHTSQLPQLKTLLQGKCFQKHLQGQWLSTAALMAGARTPAPQKVDWTHDGSMSVKQNSRCFSPRAAEGLSEARSTMPFVAAPKMLHATDFLSPGSGSIQSSPCRD